VLSELVRSARPGKQEPLGHPVTLPRRAAKARRGGVRRYAPAGADAVTPDEPEGAEDHGSLLFRP